MLRRGHGTPSWTHFGTPRDRGRRTLGTARVGTIKRRCERDRLRGALPESRQHLDARDSIETRQRE
jgi:hypothetical protein